MNKVYLNKLTAGMLSGDLKDKFFRLSAFWAVLKETKLTGRNIFDELTMVKQLKIPTFFLTLLCADLRWDELISVMAS